MCSVDGAASAHLAMRARVAAGGIPDPTISRCLAALISELRGGVQLFVR
jgi:hypothetical protein